MKLKMLEFRALVIDAVRSFFKEQGYLEVDTPLLAPTLIPESSIDIFQTRYMSEGGKSLMMNLIPSPEVWMKWLIAEGAGSMFQICKCFRNGEPEGGLHSPEFTMLEYYTLEADYIDSIGVTEKLYAHVCAAAGAKEILQPFLRLSMAEAFREYAGVDLEEALNKKVMAEACRRLTQSGREEDTWEELFNRIFVTLVEPSLPDDRPLVLFDYPAGVPTLAKAKEGTPWSQRWELYIRGVELANCYTEETDHVKVRRFFEEEMKEREERNMPVVSDPGYVDLLSHRLPPCSGVALGMDRLIMLLAGREKLHQVLPFQPFRNGRQPL